MSEINMRDINFNLLKTLHALFQEASVSKAANRLNITQSAVSLALKQLRGIFNDELMVREKGGKMKLTPLACSLITPVHEAIKATEDVFTFNIPFDPNKDSTTFHVGMSDPVAYLLLPKLTLTLHQHYPNIKIVDHRINYLDNIEQIEAENLDLIIGCFNAVPSSLKMTKAFEDRTVIVVNNRHPILRKKTLSIEEMLSYPQVFVSWQPNPEKNFILSLLQKQGHKVQVAIMTPDARIALQVLSKTNYIGHNIENLAKMHSKQYSLSMRETPYKVPKYQAKLYWHARYQNDNKHQWFRRLIKYLLIA